MAVWREGKNWARANSPKARFWGQSSVLGTELGLGDRARFSGTELGLGDRACCWGQSSILGTELDFGRALTRLKARCLCQKK